MFEFYGKITRSRNIIFVFLYSGLFCEVPFPYGKLHVKYVNKKKKEISKEACVPEETHWNVSCDVTRKSVYLEFCVR